MRCSLRAPCTSHHSPSPPPPVPHSSLWCTWGVTGLSEQLCAPAASACVPTGVGVCARMHVHVCTLPMHQLQPEIMEGAQGLQGFALTQAIHRLSIAQLIQHLANSAHINCSADQRRSAVMKGRGGTSVLSKCVHGASSVCVCGRKGNRGSECRRERSSGRVLVWAREERMAAHAWTASPAQKGGKQIQQSLSNAPEERICSSFAGRQSRRKKKRFGNACWSEGGKCAVLEWLYLLPSGFFPSSSCREL